MKRSYIGVIGLSIILLLNIIFTQMLVHQFFYQNYGIVLVYMGINIVLFPVAILVYRKEIHKGGSTDVK